MKKAEYEELETLTKEMAEAIVEANEDNKRPRISIVLKAKQYLKEEVMTRKEEMKAGLQKIVEWRKKYLSDDTNTADDLAEKIFGEPRLTQEECAAMIDMVLSGGNDDAKLK